MSKSPLRPGLALLILLAGHAFAGIFMRNLGAGLEAIADPFAAKIARVFYAAFSITVSVLGPVMMAFLAFLVYRLWRGKSVQWGIDIFGGLLTLRCLVIFGTLAAAGQGDGAREREGDQIQHHNSMDNEEGLHRLRNGTGSGGFELE